MRILIFTDNSCQSKALINRLGQFFKNTPSVEPYIRYVDASENMDDVSFYKITMLPTVLMVDKSGAAIWRMEGFDPRYEYEDAIFKQVRHAADADQFPQTARGYEKYEH